MSFLKNLSTFGLTFLTLACQSPVTATALKFDGLYVFGDSLVDNGNFYSQSKDYNFNGSPPPFPGSSATGYPGPPYYQGRFSNGPVFVEDLALKLGLPTNSVHDYAVGGATSGYNHADPLLPPATFPGTLTQVTTYIIQPADPNGLYIIAAGSDDYGSIASYTDPAIVATQIATTVGNLDRAVTLLANDGARNFLLVTVPDFGKIPLATLAPNASPESLNAQTSLAAAHNAILLDSLPGLSSSLKINIMPLDIFTL